LASEERQQAIDFMVHHIIDTGDSCPFRPVLRKYPIAHRPIIDEHESNMLENDITVPTASAWALNIVLIQKKDGGLRFCIDYRKLNDLTYKDSYPLPKIDGCLQSLEGLKYF
jgi:hypothetical protein